jgi:hypothetical protein
MTYEWMEGGFFLIQRVNAVAGGRAIKGTEYIGFDEDTHTLRSHYVDVHGSNFTYTWEIDGDTIRIWFGEKVPRDHRKLVDGALSDARPDQLLESKPAQAGVDLAVLSSVGLAFKLLKLGAILVSDVWIVAVTFCAPAWKAAALLVGRAFVWDSAELRAVASWLNAFTSTAASCFPSATFGEPAA